MRKLIFMVVLAGSPALADVGKSIVKPLPFEACLATIQQMGHAQHLPALVRCAAEAKEAKDEDLYQRLRTEIDRILPPQAPAPAAALVTP